MYWKLLSKQEKYKESYELLKSVYSDYKRVRNQQSSEQLHQISIDYELKSQALENDVVDAFYSRSHFLIVLLVILLFATALISEPILSVSKLADELVHGNSR